jgi:pyruvate/2-oxoacid:ferredoxin oxidoreductase alpha subunit
MERHVRKLEAKYKKAERRETRSECWRTEDADFILVAYGIMGRVAKAVVELGRARGLKLGLLRPITLFPFPTEEIRSLSRNVKGFAVVELSTGQLLDDVRLALEGRRPVEFYSRTGGNVPSAEETLAFLEHKFSAEEVLVHG